MSSDSPAPTPGSHAVVRLPLSRRRARRLLLLLGLGNVALLVTTAASYSVLWKWGWPIAFLAGQLDFAKEHTAAAWYASMLLLATGVAMLGCFLVDRAASDTRRDRLLDYGWLVFASAFALLSFDELGSLHERVGIMPHLPSIGLLTGWSGVLAVPIAVVGGLLVAFAWVRLRSVPTAFGLMLAAILLFLTVPLQEHLELAQWESAGGRRPALLVLVEEGTEVFGTLAFLGAALVYAYRRTESPPAAGARVSAARIYPAATIALLGAGAVAASTFGAWLASITPPWRNSFADPGLWPPAAIAALAAWLAFAAATQAGTAPGRPSVAPLAALGALLTLCSIDHAIDHWISADLWRSVPGRRLALDAALCLAILGIGVFAWTGPVLLRGRIAVLAGLAVLAASVLMPDDRRIAPAIVAYLLTALGLMRALPVAAEARMPARAASPRRTPGAVLGT